MRRVLITALIALIFGGCNLSDDNPGPQPDDTTDETTLTPPTLTPPQATDNRPTPLPGAVATSISIPGALPTRTPIGFSGPAATPIGVGGANPVGALPVPTSATGETGLITSPANGSAVAIGVLNVSGVVGGLSQPEFTLVLQDNVGNILNSQRITLQNPNNALEVPWSASMTTGSYSGPAEVRVVAKDPNGLDLVLARTAIQLGPSGPGATNPPAVQQGTGSPQVVINAPGSNEVVSGGSIQVSGLAGGISDNQFVLALVTGNGIVVTSHVVTYSATSPTVLVPWSASLSTSGFSGPAEIRAFTMTNQAVMASVQVMVQS